MRNTVACCKEIRDSGLKILGVVQANRVWTFMRGILTERRISEGIEVVAPAGDNGLLFEYTLGDRCVLFHVPQDGEAIYYTLRGRDGFCESGSIDVLSGIIEIGNWITGGDLPRFCRR
jgi:hypothetical protein